MIEDQIFVSDLDGTLLRNDATLSAYSRAGVIRLLEAGVHFTVASARSIHSMKPILGDLPFKLPVIEINGAMITNYQTFEHVVINKIETSLAQEIHALTVRHKCMPYFTTFDGKQDRLHCVERINGGMEYYYQDRITHKDARLTDTPNVKDVFKDTIVAMSVMARHDELKGLADEMDERFDGLLECFFFENPYSPGWWWLTIHDVAACKSKAILELLDYTGHSIDQLTVFGDSLNDRKMFKMAGKAVAPANADEDIKQMADEVIGANTDDAVVRYLEALI